ncbi:MAG TPA: dTDP-4-dehydrorhamnose 3,5-epimerase [Candidatus Hydrothermia bacterium]|nr:dTDP-4-dehydrorhamnose 3,5-epimerase [Candidatus Hydrothermae bacterium]MDD3648542.1 dTDP-4-dehydrorhamnose 3,5-epimerase [Candidatus Hydrothermia bacterium]MDD5572717.1 dTDP-4-dehydrorhamnose 3,5-epimerase [Candidatus Hydrothermia bacterium]HOK22598.1 dTDP-4-dehydrorhamnose 3,5-epimerase [Candidatus Hydrothermia bacterium]HOL23305.1 dTDP-4-dehydrorhamnose 3,5-epimerase [Candidatus Hydrothermia bacterium]
MRNFKFYRLEIPEVLLVEPKVFEDERGYFLEVYRHDYFSEVLGVSFVQENLSFSKKGVLRGLHFQKRVAGQAKLVQVLEGEIFDVAVNIKKGSPDFGKWVGVVLSSGNKLQLYIPEGFAHGFCVLSNSALVLYRISSYYDPDNERGIIWNDPDIGIEWPVSDPMLSTKDRNLPPLKDADIDFLYHVK